MVRKFFAALIVSMYLVIVPASAAVLSVSRTFINPPYLEERFIPESYEKVLLWLAEEIVAQGKFSNGENVSQAEIEQVLRSLFPKETYIALMNEVVRTLATEPTFVNNNLVLSFEQARTVFQQSVQDVTQHIPVCESSKPILLNDGLPSCLPGGEKGETARSRLAKKWSRVIDEVVPRRKTVAIAPEAKQAFLAFHRAVVQQRLLDIGSIAVPLAFIILLALVIFRPWQRVLLWVGLTAALSGAEFLALGRLLTFGLNPALATLPVAKQQLIISLFSHPADFLNETGIFVLIIGAALTLLGFLGKRFSMD